jgi:hypothetical protein
MFLYFYSLLLFSLYTFLPLRYNIANEDTLFLQNVSAAEISGNALCRH